MCFQMPVLGCFLQGAGHIPVLARNGRAAFDAAAELLKEGKTVGIFPEGAQSPLEGGACPAHTGVARLPLRVAPRSFRSASPCDGAHHLQGSPRRRQDRDGPDLPGRALRGDDRSAVALRR